MSSAVARQKSVDEVLKLKFFWVSQAGKQYAAENAARLQGEMDDSGDSGCGGVPFGCRALVRDSLTKVDLLAKARVRKQSLMMHSLFSVFRCYLACFTTLQIGPRRRGGVCVWCSLQLSGSRLTLLCPQTSRQSSANGAQVRGGARDDAHSAADGGHAPGGDGRRAGHTKRGWRGARKPQCCCVLTAFSFETGHCVH